MRVTLLILGGAAFPPSSLFGGAALVGVAFPLLFGVVLQSLRPFWVVFLSLPPLFFGCCFCFFVGGAAFLPSFCGVASFHFLGVVLPLSILNQTRVKGSEVNESNVVLLSGGVVFPASPVLGGGAVFLCFPFLCCALLLLLVLGVVCFLLLPSKWCCSHLRPFFECECLPSASLRWCRWFSSKFELNTVNAIKPSQIRRSECEFFLNEIFLFHF